MAEEITGNTFQSLELVALQMRCTWHTLGWGALKTRKGGAEDASQWESICLAQAQRMKGQEEGREV